MRLCLSKTARLLLVGLILGGCIPDQPRDVAACETEAIRVYPKQPAVDLGDFATRYINACMAAKGYDFTILAAGCNPRYPFATQPECYTPTGWIAQFIDWLKRPRKSN